MGMETCPCLPGTGSRMGTEVTAGTLLHIPGVQEVSHSPPCLKARSHHRELSMGLPLP